MSSQISMNATLILLPRRRVVLPGKPERALKHEWNPKRGGPCEFRYCTGTSTKRVVHTIAAACHIDWGFPNRSTRELPCRLVREARPADGWSGRMRVAITHSSLKLPDVTDCGR